MRVRMVTLFALAIWVMMVMGRFRLLHTSENMVRASFTVSSSGVMEPEASTKTKIKRSASSDRSFRCQQHFLSARKGSL